MIETNSIAFLYPIGLIIAMIVGYIAYKKHWKIVDFF